MISDSLPLNDRAEKSQSGPIIFTFCMLSALMVFLVYSRNFVFGSEAGKWVYPYYDNVPSLPLWLPLAMMLLLGLPIFLGSKLIHTHVKTTLLVSFLAMVMIQILIQAIFPVSLAAIIQSDNLTTYYSQAGVYTPAEFLSHYTNLVDSLPGHLETNMPGKLLLFQLMEIFTTSPVMIAYLIVVLSTLGAPLLYVICVSLFHDRLTGFYAFILYALIPSKQFFLPILNSVTPIFILLCLYLFLLYLERRKTIALVLLGIALYILILFEPSPLITGLIFLGILIFNFAQKKLLLPEIMRIVIVTVAAFSVTYLFFSLVFSFDLLQAVAYVMKHQSDFNSGVRPGYTIWLGENIKIFSYVVGLPITMIVIYRAAQIIAESNSIKSFIRNWSIEKTFLFSVLVTFLTLLLWGIVRGEITRIWIFMAVFFQIPVAYFMAKIVKRNILFFLVAGTLVAQSIITVHRVAFLRP